MQAELEGIGCGVALEGSSRPPKTDSTIPLRGIQPTFTNPVDAAIEAARLRQLQLDNQIQQQEQQLREMQTQRAAEPELFPTSLLTAAEPKDTTAEHILFLATKAGTDWDGHLWKALGDLEKLGLVLGYRDGSDLVSKLVAKNEKVFGDN
jgi:FtsZ-interacting cell division protein ZipA